MSIALVQHKAGNGTVFMDSTPIDGNLMFMWLTERAVGDYPVTPAGWTSLATATETSIPFGGTFYARLVSRIASGEPGSYAIGSSNYLATIMEWSGATYGAEVAQSNQNGNDLAVPLTCGGAITPTENVSAVVGCAVIGMFGGTGVTEDAGVTVIDSTDWGSNPSRNWVGYKALTVAASTTIGGTMVGRKEFGGVTFTLLGAPDPPTPGIWYDWDRDGFDDVASASTLDAPLARMLPEGGSTVSDLVTSDVISIDIDRVADIFGGTPTGTMRIVTKNPSGRYNPDNTGSPVYLKTNPGLPGWFGCNADGSLSGTGQAVYGRFGGYLRTCAPIPAGGATDAPTVEWLFDDAMTRYRDAKARVDFAEDRSIAEYREAILDTIGETRLDLATEADTLPVSGDIGVTSSVAFASRFAKYKNKNSVLDILDGARQQIARRPVVTALAVLEDLNHLVGTRHFIAPADTKEDWYTYSTRNRQYKLGSAADADLTAGYGGSDSEVHEMAGYVHSRDGIINQINVEARPFRIAGQPFTVWDYSAVPFSVSPTSSKLIVADFGDIVFDPVLTIRSAGGQASATMAAYGNGAVIQVSAGFDETVTQLTIDGTPVIRQDPIMVEASDAASMAAYGPISGPDLSSDYMTSEGLAEAIAAYTIWANKEPRKTPSIGIVNQFTTILPLDLFDVVTMAVEQLDVTTKRFEIIGLHERWEASTDSGIRSVSFTLDLRQTPNPTALSLLTFGTSTYGGSDVFAP